MSDDDNADQERWRQWLRRHGDALLLLARQRCVSIADAEDAVQDGFIRFWNSRQHAADSTAYLFACVRSAAIDLSRGQRRRERLKDELGLMRRDDLFEPSTDPLEAEEFRRAVESALVNLPEEQREVLALKTWSGLTFAQIAEVLAIKPDTAASRYRYALLRLKGLLKPVEVRHE